jgi:hypothetical protein
MFVGIVIVRVMGMAFFVFVVAASLGDQVRGEELRVAIRGGPGWSLMTSGCMGQV